MKTVLIIAPQFSPCSYPPVHRIRHFTNHLDEFGWKPVLLSIEPEFMEEPADWEFQKLIPASLEIIRTKALPQRWTRRIGVGDIGLRSLPYHLKAARELCERRKIDLIFVTGPPWFSFLVGPP